MNTPHSKAPWTANRRGEIRSAEGDLVAQVYDNPGEEEALKNISLIGAAPELLAACKLFVEWCQTPDLIVDSETIEAIHDAVKKAETEL